MNGPSGADLVHQLWTAARASGVSLGEFVRPLTGHPAKYLRQLREAHRPGPMTVERIRALIAGETVPLPQSRAVMRSVRPAASTVRDDLEWRRALGEAAIAERLPGETLADAVRRIEREIRAQPFDQQREAA